MTAKDEGRMSEAEGQGPDRGLMKRRGLMAGAAALTVGLLAQRTTGESVSAAVGPVLTDTMNTVTLTTGVQGVVASGPAWRAINNPPAPAPPLSGFPPAADGIQGFAGGGGNGGVFGSNGGGVGIWGATSNGFAVLGDGNSGYGGLFRSDFAQLLITPQTTVTFPTPGPHQKGELLVASTGSLYYCAADGTPGTWREVAGPSTVGSLHMLASPDRYVDTRSGLGGVVGTQPPNTTRVYQMTGRAGQNGVVIPADAVAIVGTLTALGGPGALPGSFLTAWPGGPQPPVSNINYGPGQVLAAAFTSALGSGGVLSVFNRTDADYLIDVVGYYR